MTAKRKHPSDRLASLAGKVLQGYQPTPDEIKAMAAAILSLDVVPGPNKSEAAP
jgi:hypothetical protein